MTGDRDKGTGSHLAKGVKAIVLLQNQLYIYLLVRCYYCACSARLIDTQSSINVSSHHV